MTTTRRTPIAGAALLLTLIAPPVVAQEAEVDGVTAMCLESAAEPVCSCASDALREAVGAEAYDLYAEVGTGYVARREAGEGRAEAWTAALAPVAEARGLGTTALMSQTNETGGAHREAMEGCAG